jgi:hypothetical protein
MAYPKIKAKNAISSISISIIKDGYHGDTKMLVLVRQASVPTPHAYQLRMPAAGN